MLSPLRSLVFLAFQLLFTPPYALAVLALAWMGPIQRYRFITFWCRANLWAARALCGIRPRVIGLENMPATPHVVMSKHSSTWETLFLTQLFPPLANVAKKELLAIPFFGWAFRFASPITIDRKAGHAAMAQMAEQARTRIAEGFWIVVYPEGTRIPAGTRSAYKTGGARIALALDLPILPVAHNAGWLWPKGILGKQSGLVTLSIGASIPPAGRDAASLTREVENWIEAEVERLGHPNQRPGAPALQHGAR